MNVTRELTVDLAPWVLTLSILAVLVVIGLAFYGWQRSGYDRRVGALEFMRVVLALMAAITLAQPEWKETYQPTDLPVLAVLRDRSGSMDTQDVLLVAGQSAATPSSAADAGNATSGTGAAGTGAAGTGAAGTGATSITDAAAVSPSGTQNAQPATAPSGDSALTRTQLVDQLTSSVDWSRLAGKIEVVQESFAANSARDGNGPGEESPAAGASGNGAAGSSTDQPASEDKQGNPEGAEKADEKKGSATAAVSTQGAGAAPPAPIDPGATDINAALAKVMTDQPRLRAVVLLSDGDWNQGESPTNAATKLRVNQVPVFVLPTGSDEPLPDIEIASLEPPTFSVVGKALQIPFSLRSTMSVDYPVEVTLTVDRGTKLTRQVVVPAKGQVRDVFFWTPDDVGDVEVTLNVPPHADEVIKKNNESTVTVGVKAEALKVLVIESYPRWEYRYLRNALERDPGVDVSCLLFHPGLSKRGGGSGYLKEFPPNPEDLAKFDVVLLGDVGVETEQLTTEQCEQIKGLVEQQASGLIFLPGMRGHQFSLVDSPLSDLYPVQLDNQQLAGVGSRVPAQLILTELGESSLLTKLADTPRENAAVWRGLPGFQWRAPVLRAKAGSEVLAVHEQSRTPLLVTKTFGTGKILFMGTDGAWRWREGVEDKYHYRFWGQVARWMAYQRHMAEGEMIRMFYSPDRPTAGNTVILNATVLDPAGAPLKQATVTGELADPRGGIQKLRFQSNGEDWGLYTARFSPSQAGPYRLTLRCQETNAVLDATIQVQGEEREQVGKPARPEVLEELARITRGEVLAADNFQRVTEQILSLPPPEPTVRRKQLWASPLWAGVFLTLLSIFWIGRKVIGSI